MVGVHPGLYMPPYYHTLGTPTVPPCYMATSRTRLGVQRWSPGLRKEKQPGWEGREPLRTLRVWEKVCLSAQSPSSSLRNKVERLDRRRVYPRYIPYVRLCCSESSFLLRPSDRGRTAGRAGRGGRVNVNNVTSMGYSLGFCTLLTIVDHAAQTVSRNPVRASPISLLGVPKIDTGGERWVFNPPWKQA